MRKDELRDFLKNAATHFAALEGKARSLANQNFADIAARAKSCAQQLADHPDFERVTEDGEPAKYDPGVTQLDQTVFPDGTPVSPAPLGGPAAQPPGFMEPGPFPGSEIGGPDRGKEGTHVPGEPRFEPNANNPNFQQPNAVDLNASGTLQHAPNAAGAPAEEPKAQ